MITVYVKPLEEKDNIKKLSRIKYIRKIQWMIIQRFNIIQVEQLENNKIVYLIPNINKTSIYNKVIKKIKLEKTKTENVQIVLSKKVKQYKELFENCKIIDGKKIFFSNVEGILQKLLRDNSIAFEDIYVLTNNYKEKNINLIKNLIQKVKTVNIITNEIQKYEILEEMLEESGTPISVANNKRKSLKNAKIIINLDFAEEELSKYSICRNAIIINLTQEKLTGLKGFGGIIIRDIRNKIRRRKTTIYRTK